jgi:hypothetical protein
VPTGGEPGGGAVAGPASGALPDPGDGALGAAPPPIDNDGPESDGTIGDDPELTEPLELLEPPEDDPELLGPAFASPVAFQSNPSISDDVNIAVTTGCLDLTVRPVR